MFPATRLKQKSCGVSQVIAQVAKLKEAIGKLKFLDDKIEVGSFVLAGTNKSQDYPVRCDNDLGPKRRRM